MLTNRKRCISIIILLSIFCITIAIMVPNNVEAIGNNYFEEIMNRNIMTPYSDGSYKLDKYVTRAEYLTALYKTVCVIDYYDILNDIEIEEKRVKLIENIKKVHIEDSTYKDLNKHWSKNTVNLIKKYIDERKPNYFKEIFPGDQFNPDELITKQEIAAVTILFSTSPISIDKEKYRSLKDIDESNKFYNQIILLLENKIIECSEENYFGSSNFITRNDMAIIINNLLNDMNFRKNFFIYNEIKEDKNDKLYKYLFTSIEMYQQGEENIKIYKYLINIYRENKDILNEKQYNYYVWALKSLMLCGL